MASRRPTTVRDAIVGESHRAATGQPNRLVLHALLLTIRIHDHPVMHGRSQPGHHLTQAYRTAAVCAPLQTRADYAAWRGASRPGMSCRIRASQLSGAGSVRRGHGSQFWRLAGGHAACWVVNAMGGPRSHRGQPSHARRVCRGDLRSPARQQAEMITVLRSSSWVMYRRCMSGQGAAPRSSG